MRARGAIVCLGLVACAVEAEPLPEPAPAAAPLTIPPPGFRAVDEDRRRTLSIVNASDGPLTVRWRAEGAGACDGGPGLCVDPAQGGARLEAGASTPVEVAYTRTPAPSRSEGALVVECVDRAGCATRAPLAGETAAAPRRWWVLPERLPPFSARLGGAAAAELLIANEGAALVTVTPTLLGDADFSIEPPGPWRVGAGDSATVEVWFRPEEIGDRAGELTLAADAGASVTLPLEGFGVGRERCYLEVRPEALDFGVVDPDRIHARSIELYNGGNAPCAVEVLPSDPPGLVEVSLARVDLAPGDAVTARVDVDASLACPGSHVERARLLVDGRTRAFEVRFSAADPAPLVVPDAIDFGEVPMGCEQQRTVQVYNIGARPIRLIDVETSYDPLSVERPALPARIEPGASLDLSVRLTGVMPGPSGGDVTLRFERAGSPSCPRAALEPAVIPVRLDAVDPPPPCE